MINKRVINSNFVRKTASIAIPVAIQGMMNTVLNMVDTMMIGSIGETPLAAVGLANKVFFVLSLLLFGIASGSCVMTAQYWGNKDVKSARRVLGISIIIAVSSAFMFCLAGLFIPEKVMRIFTPQADTIALGVEYLKIVAITYPVQALTQCYVYFNRAVGRVKMPVIVSGVAIFINICLNYTLITGKFGMPALGVRGAAVGTLVARFIECILVVGGIYLSKGPGAAKLREMFDLSIGFLKKYFSTVTPVIFNEFLWGLGITLYALAYGRMGDGAVAAITITQTIEDLFVSAFMGLSSATGVILGNEMGAGNLKDAKRHAGYFLRFCLVLSIGFAILIYLLRGGIVGMYDISPTVKSDVMLCLRAFCCYMPLRMMNYVIVVGVLRSGGDTKFALFLDCSSVWLIGVPMAFIGGLVFKLPIYWVYAMVLSEDIYKIILGLWRYKKRKWLRNIAEEQYE